MHTNIHDNQSPELEYANCVFQKHGIWTWRRP